MKWKTLNSHTTQTHNNFFQAKINISLTCQRRRRNGRQRNAKKDVNFPSITRRQGDRKWEIFLATKSFSLTYVAVRFLSELNFISDVKCKTSKFVSARLASYLYTFRRFLSSDRKNTRITFQIAIFGSNSSFFFFQKEKKFLFVSFASPPTQTHSHRLAEYAFC